MSIRHSLLCASFCVSTVFTSFLPLAAEAANSSSPAGAVAPAGLPWGAHTADDLPTATPIKHLVIIYDENVAFDHYFGTYPKASNVSGEPVFRALPGTKTPDNLLQDNLLTNNPSLNPANGAGAGNPFRLDRTQAATQDQNHSYTPEQEAYDNGKADLFPLYTGSGSQGGSGEFYTKGQVLGYYDGNTVTALWNYAQHYALDDNAYTNTYGPSTPGALETVSGQTDGVVAAATYANGTSALTGTQPASTVKNTVNGATDYTLVGDDDPALDVCAKGGIISTAKNIGDLLNRAKITWGGFMGGFDLTLTNANGTTGCARSTPGVVTDVEDVTAPEADYIQHHNWFQYFPSTANPTHARPVAVTDIGYSFDHNGKADPANHEYDEDDFFAAVAAGNFPAVSYIKQIGVEDGHAGYSDPLDEQVGIVKLVNFLEKQPDWKNTAIIIAYDDSDGWYDHRYTTPTSPSFSSADQLNGNGVCGKGTAPKGLGGQPINGRCGPGTRVPFLVISPWSKSNYIDDTPITQASIVRFIEDNWLRGERLGGGSFDATAGSIEALFNFHCPQKRSEDSILILDPTTGERI
jgi:phospholipase C